ncbi:hypothetical protein CBL21_26785 [Shigella flexneri]|nr:hypothetical protein CBL21_26785 [Shigella flexneri]
MVICFDLAIDQIAQSGLSSLKVIYYSAQLFNIVNGTPIHERSRNIDNRRSLGHWEGDLVSGTKNSHIATLVDRKSRYTIIEVA